MLARNTRNGNLVWPGGTPAQSRRRIDKFYLHDFNTGIDTVGRCTPYWPFKRMDVLLFPQFSKLQNNVPWKVFCQSLTAPIGSRMALQSPQGLSLIWNERRWRPYILTNKDFLFDIWAISFIYLSLVDVQIFQEYRCTHRDEDDISTDRNAFVLHRNPTKMLWNLMDSYVGCSLFFMLWNMKGFLLHLLFFI